LFDAVAALAGLRQRVNYEAQAAIELEMAMHDTSDAGSHYPLSLVREGRGWLLDTKPLFEEMIRDLRQCVPTGLISRRFHNGMVNAFTNLSVLLRERTWLNRVCLSGGTFQNVYLLEHLQSNLRARDFEVFAHSEVPSGDGGLSLGQALVAAHRLRR
jgi:hydrogenase maturation protein HypF